MMELIESAVSFTLLLIKMKHLQDLTGNVLVADAGIDKNRKNQVIKLEGTYLVHAPERSLSTPILLVECSGSPSSRYKANF